MHQMVCGNHTFQAKQTHLDLPQDFVDQGPFFELVLNIFWMQCVRVCALCVCAGLPICHIDAKRAGLWGRWWTPFFSFMNQFALFLSSLHQQFEHIRMFFSLMFTAFEQEQGQGLSIKKHMEQISSAYGLRKTLNCCMTPNRAGTVWLHSWIQYIKR